MGIARKEGHQEHTSGRPEDCGLDSMRSICFLLVNLPDADDTVAQGIQVSQKQNAKLKLFIIPLCILIPLFKKELLQL